MPKQFKDEKHKQKIINRIQKMMALSGGTKFEEEAKTAMRMAKNLMKSYGLSMTEVEVKEMLEEDLVHEFVDLNHGLNKWEEALAQAVAVVFEVSPLIGHKATPKGFRPQIAFVGYKQDVDMAKMLHVTLLIAARKEARRNYPDSKQRRRSFLYGLCVRLYERANEEKQKDVQEGTGFSLIVVEKEKRIQDKLEELNVETKKTKVNNNIDPEAYIMGMNTAESMDLNNREKIS